MYINEAPAVAFSDARWKSKFPNLSVLILAICQCIFIIVIIALEIASLAIYVYDFPTGVGIWSAIFFLTACILTFILAKQKHESKTWATIVLIAQIVLLIFSWILIGITAYYINSRKYLYDIPQGYNDKLVSKYRIIQAELAFGVLLMFSGFIYIGIYIYVVIAA